MILSIPLSSAILDDYLTWHYTSDGVYTDRNGYNMGMSLIEANSGSGGPSRSGFQSSVSWWKAFWRIDVPYKIKVFLWKAYHHWLPTEANIAKRGVHLDVTCASCSRCPETTIHSLWGCAKLKEVRVECGFMKGHWWDNNLQFLNFLISAVQSLRDDDLALLWVVLWRIWFTRNQLIHTNMVDDLKNVVAAYKAANAYVVDDQRCLGTIEEARWRPPTKPMYKINTDASIQTQSNCIGVGIVIHDRSGWVMGSSAQRIQACFTPQIAKAIAILRGVDFARDMGLLPDVVESDALGVVKHINDGTIISADVGLVLSDILHIMCLVGIESVLFVSRKVNMVAHYLSKMALAIDQDRFWVEEFPPDMGNLVQKNLPM
ncbi:hypothetical protein Ddye_000555 [Dipteronia dyeriana]|uniref:RNase H type-1 domain-containing protein n=1 Tax=Dipteronia dyeriana TaxID=168575 RepID=A0AAD9XLV7_9ROSI|nr:hypothetical protein Ddye_000555 [Dipteronia dyeriana]